PQNKKRERSAPRLDGLRPFRNPPALMCPVWFWAQRFMDERGGGAPKGEAWRRFLPVTSSNGLAVRVSGRMAAAMIGLSEPKTQAVMLERAAEREPGVGHGHIHFYYRAVMNVGRRCGRSRWVEKERDSSVEADDASGLCAALDTELAIGPP